MYVEEGKKSLPIVELGQWMHPRLTLHLVSFSCPIAVRNSIRGLVEHTRSLTRAHQGLHGRVVIRSGHSNRFVSFANNPNQFCGLTQYKNMRVVG